MQRFPHHTWPNAAINNKLSDYAPISRILTCLTVLNNIQISTTENVLFTFIILLINILVRSHYCTAPTLRVLYLNIIFSLLFVFIQFSMHFWTIIIKVTKLFSNFFCLTNNFVKQLFKVSFITMQTVKTSAQTFR